MEEFSQLVQQVRIAQKSESKLSAVFQFLKTASDSDQLMLVQLVMGNLYCKLVSQATLKLWAQEVSQLPDWLFEMSLAQTNDQLEALALVLPNNEGKNEQNLAQWLVDIRILSHTNEEAIKQFVLQSWSSLPADQRYVFNQLVTGSLRIAVSKKIVAEALARVYKKEYTHMMHLLSEDNKRSMATMQDFFNGNQHQSILSTPYAFPKVQRLDQPIADLGSISEWQLEQLWNGLPVQLIKRQGEVYLWSQSGEIINHAFPELIETVQNAQHDFVVFGELLSFQQELKRPSDVLQERMKRKRISKKLIEQQQVALIARDCLEFLGEDKTDEPLTQRRALLEELVTQLNTERILLSELAEVDTWDNAQQLRKACREQGSSGLLLKKSQSTYQDSAYFWPVEAITLSAVLLYAHRDEQNRSRFSELSFGIQGENELVVIAKTANNLPGEQLETLHQFIKENTLESFGPVQTVKAELVAELTCSAITQNKRRKSGLELHDVQLIGLRPDQTIDEINPIESLRNQLLTSIS